MAKFNTMLTPVWIGKRLLPMAKFKTVAQNHDDFVAGCFKDTMLTPVERNAIKIAFYSGFTAGIAELTERAKAKDVTAIGALSIELREYFELTLRGID